MDSNGVGGWVGAGVVWYFTALCAKQTTGPSIAHVDSQPAAEATETLTVQIHTWLIDN